MTLLKLIALVTIYLTGLISADDFENLCKIIENTSPEYQLKRQLLCDYDPSVRPAPQGNKTEFTIILSLLFADYNEKRNELELHTALTVRWIDSFLTWEPSNFNGIRVINIKSYEVWTPEIYSMNPNDVEMRAIPESMCSLNYMGKMVCQPTRVFIAPCESDYTKWPYDTHNCTVKLGTPTYIGNGVSASKKKSGIFTEHYNSHPQWEISIERVRYRRIRSKMIDGEMFETIGVSFLLNRPYTSLKSVMISPAIILTVVTLTTLWLRPGSTERLILSCINLLGHLFTLRNIHLNIPDTGDTVPNILIFYNNSLILSAMALILTCWLHRLLESKREVPMWLGKSVSAIIESKPGQLLSASLMEPTALAFLQTDDDMNSLVDSEPKKSTWENIVTVICWLSFSSFLLIYIIVSAVLL